MGLIYSSGDSQTLMAGLSNNLGTAKSTIEQLKSGSQNLTAAVDGQTLSGAAYTAGKGLFTDLILPTIDRVTSSAEAVQADLASYRAADGAVGESYLNEDNLQMQITIKKAMKAALDASIHVYRRMAMTNPVAGLCEYLFDVADRLTGMSDSMQDDIDKLQEKLEKLRNFASQTSGLFTDSMANFKIAMQGVMVLNGTTVNADGTYRLPPGTDKSWFTEQKSCQEIEDRYKDGSLKGQDIFSQFFSKDPVNLSTGNFIYDRTDLKIEGEPSFIFRRFYNAINTRKGSLGKDWQHNYEVRLLTEGNQKVLIREDGKEEVFQHTPDGAYVSVYDSRGTLTKTAEGFCYHRRGKKTYRFDEQGNYRSVEDQNGNKIQMYYEEINQTMRLKKAEKDTGEFFSFSYDEEGNLSSVTDHTGRSVRYSCQDGLLREVTDSMGHTFRYQYTTNGKLKTVQNPREIITVENVYDGQQRVIRQHFPDGGSMTYAYDDEKREVELTERNGSKITYVHDEKFRDIRHLYHDSEERFEYNGYNQKILIVDRLGNKTRLAYDERGNLTQMINALGIKTEFAYEENNQLTYLAIQGKEKLQNRYDEKGNLLSSKDALGRQTQFTYEEKGRPGSIRQADGSTLYLRYDARGNITELRDASGSIHYYTYDNLNRVVKSIDGKGNCTKYTYLKCYRTYCRNKQSDLSLIYWWNVTHVL